MVLESKFDSLYHTGTFEQERPQIVGPGEVVIHSFFGIPKISIGFKIRFEELTFEFFETEYYFVQKNITFSITFLVCPVQYVHK